MSVNTKLKCLTFPGQKFMSNSCHIYNHYAVVSKKYNKFKMSDHSWSIIHVQQLSHILYNHYAVVSKNIIKLKCQTSLGPKFMSNSCHIYNHYAVVSKKYNKFKMSDHSWSIIHVQQLSHILYNHYAVVSKNIIKLKCQTSLGPKFMSNSCRIYNH